MHDVAALVFDVFGTVYNASEYGDRADNNLGDCAMVDSNLANGGDLDGAAGAGTDVVLWYRVGVRDALQRLGEGLQAGLEAELALEDELRLRRAPGLRGEPAHHHPVEEDGPRARGRRGLVGPRPGGAEGRAQAEEGPHKLPAWQA